MTKDEILVFLKTQKVFLQHKYGVLSIGLFGSYARGDYHENSDIDLFIYGDDLNLEKNKYENLLNHPIQIFNFKNMRILIKATNIELTPEIKEYTAEKINSLDKYFNNIIEAKVEIGINSARHQKGEIFFCEVNIAVPNRLLRVKKTEKKLQSKNQRK